MANEILVVGSVAFDSIKTPCASVEQALGGSANYFSISASFFTPINLVGVVGKDFPDSHIDFLRSRKINTDGLEVVDGKTFHWTGEYKDDFNEAITHYTDLNVFADFNPKIPDHYKKSPYVFLGNIVPDLQMSVLDQIEKPKIVALDTMNFWITGAHQSLLNVLKRIDLLIINDGEARLLSEQDNIYKAAEKILSFGPKALIIKRGEYGALAFAEGKLFSTAVYPLAEITDPTGAGDTFAGGVMGYLAQTGSDLTLKALKEAILRGSVMASFNVEEFSFRRLQEIQNSDVEARVQKLREIVSL